ncbi:MAG: Rieske 2Fe-2S domain-containing protein [Phycisphaerae bacterium]|nr:Rieske 2Fe-2S domain-containing protein [Phycisphaerae bacterium]
MQEPAPMRNAISEDLFNRVAGYVPGLNAKGALPLSAQKPWQKWVDAELGFRNHWYPVLPSRSIPEGGHKAVKVLGEELLYLRRGGKLYVIEDRCAHRGTRFSVRPLTFTNDTITCWHHTFTFDLGDGRIRCLLNDPNSAMCGQKGIKSYPVRELKGVVFTFIGDIAPPPVECDVAPGFFDDDVAICVAEPYVVKANWRLGAEGGFDPGHHFIHNWSTWSACAGLPMTFGWVPNQEVVVETNVYRAEKLGQNGFTRLASKSDVTSTNAWIPARDGGPDVEVVLPMARGFSPAQREAYEKSSYDGTVGGWMPGSLKVDWWPSPGIVHNEYYVPRDADSHYYFQVGWFRSPDPKLREEWANGELGQVRWKIPVVDQFTIDDATAREATHEFYAREGGWQQERTAPFDIELLMWRTFCSDHARGVQKVEHTHGKFPR